MITVQFGQGVKERDPSPFFGYGVRCTRGSLGMGQQTSHPGDHRIATALLTPILEERFIRGSCGTHTSCIADQRQGPFIVLCLYHLYSEASDCFRAGATRACDLRKGRYRGVYQEQLWISVNLVTAPLISWARGFISLARRPGPAVLLAAIRFSRCDWASRSQPVGATIP